MSIRTNKASRSIVAAAMLLPTTLLCAEQRYQDPGGQYSLPVPDGWQVVQQKSGVALNKDPAYAALMKVHGKGTSRALVEAIGGQIASQWKDFNNANAADCKVAGQAGYCAWYSGTNPKGVEAVLKLSGIAVDGLGYVLYMSAPREAFAANKSVFDRIERGFRLEGGR